jgi:hypothetical protein
MTLAILYLHIPYICFVSQILQNFIWIARYSYAVGKNNLLF